MARKKIENIVTSAVIGGLAGATILSQWIAPAFTGTLGMITSIATGGVLIAKSLFNAKPQDERTSIMSMFGGVLLYAIANGVGGIGIMEWFGPLKDGIKAVMDGLAGGLVGSGIIELVKKKFG